LETTSSAVIVVASMLVRYPLRPTRDFALFKEASSMLLPDFVVLRKRTCLVVFTPAMMWRAVLLWEYTQMACQAIIPRRIA
jgi:hypothetical protein